MQQKVDLSRVVPTQVSEHMALQRSLASLAFLRSQRRWANACFMCKLNEILSCGGHTPSQSELNPALCKSQIGLEQTEWLVTYKNVFTLEDCNHDIRVTCMIAVMQWIDLASMFLCYVKHKTICTLQNDWSASIPINWITCKAQLPELMRQKAMILVHCRHRVIDS